MNIPRLAFFAFVFAAALIIGADIDHQIAKARDPMDPVNWSQRLRDELEIPRPNDPTVVYGIHHVYTKTLEDTPQLFRLTPERLVNCGQDWECFEGQNDPPYVRDAMPHECNSPWGCFVDTDNRIVPRGPNDVQWINCTTDLDCLQKHGHAMSQPEEDDDPDDGSDDAESGDEFA